MVKTKYIIITIKFVNSKYVTITVNNNNAYIVKWLKLLNETVITKKIGLDSF